MPSEPIFFAYLLVALLSLSVHFLLGAGQRPADAWPAALNWLPMPVAMACFGAVLLLIPIFYLVYSAGLVPAWRYTAPHVALNLVLPLAWAHFAINAWCRGKMWPARDLPGLTLLLTVPVLFIGIHSGLFGPSRTTMVMANWVLFLVGFIPWLQERRTARSG